MDYEYVGLGLTEQQTGGLITSGASTGAALLTTALIAGSAAGPIGTAVGAVVGLIGSLITSLFAPNLQKIQASNDANQIEPILQQNLNNWLSIPTNQRYASVQAAALQVFDAAWAQYQQSVQPDLSKAPDSVSDRQDGSCAYHTAVCAGWNGDTYVPNGQNQSSGCCWNWFVGYRDPIANDPNVIPDPVASSVSSVGTDLTSLLGGSSDTSGMIWIGLALLVGGFLVSSSN